MDSLSLYLTSFTGQNFLHLIFYLAVLVVILFIAYYVTKWIAGYQKSQVYNKNFEVVETMKVANNKFLQIVRVGKDDYYVIAIGKDEIHMLGKLDKEQISFENSTSDKGGFSDIFAYFKDRSDPGKDYIDKEEMSDTKNED